MLKKYLYFFIKKSSERQHRAYYRDYYRAEYAEFERCADKKSPARIRREMRCLQRYWKTYPFQYIRYRLYRKDCPLSMEQMKAYIPDYFAYFLFYPQSFNERNVLCEDKRLFASLCRGYGINHPRVLLSVSDGVLFDGGENPCTAERVLARIQASGVDRLFVKPTFGVGGKGIEVFDLREGRYLRTPDGRLLNAAYVEELKGDEWIVEEGLVHHPEMAAIYPHAICTFRIVTRNEKNSVSILFSLLRVGQGAMQVDNASSGGLYMQVDAVTGKFAARAYAFDGRVHEKHPDTGFVFGDYTFPYWEELSRFVTLSAQKLNKIKYIGWDIAYTPDGPVVIEANNGPGVSILQDSYGGLRDAFGIRNPKDYWFASNYALKNL